MRSPEGGGYYASLPPPQLPVRRDLAWGGEYLLARTRSESLQARLLGEEEEKEKEAEAEGGGSPVAASAAANGAVPVPPDGVWGREAAAELCPGETRRLRRRAARSRGSRERPLATPPGSPQVGRGRARCGSGPAWVPGPRRSGGWPVLARGLCVVVAGAPRVGNRGPYLTPGPGPESRAGGGPSPR